MPVCVIDCDGKGVKLPEKEAGPVRVGVELLTELTDTLLLPV